MHRLYVMQRETHLIVEDMLASVELVSRMGRDIGRERRLIDAHILQADPLGMSEIEAELGEVHSDFVKAAISYEPLVTLPGERAAWERLHSREQTMELKIANLLAISRDNDDVRARAGLYELESRFQEIAEDVADLIQINREGAERQVERVTLLQDSVTRLQMLLSIAGTAITLAIGLWVIHLIGQRENQLVQNSATLEARNRADRRWAVLSVDRAGGVAQVRECPLQPLHGGASIARPHSSACRAGTRGWCLGSPVLILVT